MRSPSTSPPAAMAPAPTGTGTPTKQQQSKVARGPRLRAEGVMAPPASDAATLRRQVAALQSDVEAHIEAEQRLQTLNHQLNERLEVYMKQNHQNLERAANEMNTLHEDMQQTLELQRRLSQRASTLESEKKELEHEVVRRKHYFEAERSTLELQLASLMDELVERSHTDAEIMAVQVEFDKTLSMNSELQELIGKNNREAMALKHKVEECKKKLQGLHAEECLLEQIEQHRNKAFLRRSFTRFLDGLYQSRLTRSQERAADNLYRLMCCKKGFYALHLATQRARRIRMAYKMHYATFLRDVWNEWRALASSGKKYAAALRQQRRMVLLKAFFGWKNLLHFPHCGWGQYADLAAKHWRGYLVRRAWDKWALWLTHFSKPKRMKLDQAVMHLNGVFAKQTLKAWKRVVNKKKERRKVMQRARAHRDHTSMRAAFLSWKRCLTMKREKLMLSDKAKGFHRNHCYRLALGQWLNYVAAKTSRAAANAKAVNFYETGLKFKELRLWKQNAKFQKAEAKALQGFNQALLKTALGFWLDFHILQSLKLKREKKAIVHRRRLDMKFMRKVMLMWWELMIWSKHATEMQHLLTSWWQRFLLRAAFHSWIHTTFENALRISSQFQAGLQDANEKCEKQKHRTTAVDVENLHLIDRLHLMSSEIAYLMLTINEKTGRRQELQHALEDAAVVESSMRCDLEQQRVRIRDLESQASNLQRGLQKKNKEDVASEVYHAMRIQGLEQSLRNVQTQLSNKLSQVESYEKALKDTADRLEGKTDESHQKLSNAFQIAASLRLLLEERENQCALLEGSCRRRDLELDEVQRKLNVHKSAYIESLEARDSRINELEKLLLQKQAQLEEVHNDVQDVQQAINVQENCYKKLEYEMRLQGTPRWEHCEGVWLT